MSEVPGAPEEAREEVEGVVVLAVAALLVLREPVVPILVVDFARFGLDEGFVGFGYRDEVVVGLVVVSGGWVSLEGRS